MHNMTVAETHTAERWFRNYIKQFWQYLSDVEISGDDELRDEYFLSIKHGLQRPQAEKILSDMKRQIMPGQFSHRAWGSYE